MTRKTRKLACIGVAATVLSGCAGSRPVGGPDGKGVPFEDITLQSLLRWPSDREYVEATGYGRPGDGEREQEPRRKTARNAAVIDAQEKLIPQLEKLAGRRRVVELLRKAQVARLDYGYDDACTAVLRVPKEAISGKPAVE